MSPELSPMRGIGDGVESMSHDSHQVIYWGRKSRGGQMAPDSLCLMGHSTDPGPAQRGPRGNLGWLTDCVLSSILIA